MKATLEDVVKAGRELDRLDYDSDLTPWYEYLRVYDAYFEGRS